MNKHKHMAHILMVDDSEDDFEVVERALRRHDQKRIALHHSSDGRHALNFLRHTCQQCSMESCTRPALILLDLNLPGIDGISILKTIKNDPSLQTIPVVILSTSDNQREIQNCYRLGASSYINKPVDLEEFTERITQLWNYWFSVVRLPEEYDSGIDSHCPHVVKAE